MCVPQALTACSSMQASWPLMSNFHPIVQAAWGIHAKWDSLYLASNLHLLEDTATQETPLMGIGLRNTVPVMNLVDLLRISEIVQFCSLH